MDKTGFDLEAAIAACWQTKDDLDLLFEEVLEGNISSEDVANALMGLALIHQMRSSKAQRIFEELVRNGIISLSADK